MNKRATQKDTSRQALYIGSTYPRTCRERRQKRTSTGHCRRREDRRVEERRQGRLDLYGPNRLPLEWARAA